MFIIFVLFSCINLSALLLYIALLLLLLLFSFLSYPSLSGEINKDVHKPRVSCEGLTCAPATSVNAILTLLRR